MRQISEIVIHEADTPNGQEFHIQDIDEWHVQRGFHRSDEFRLVFNPTILACGYHYVIYIDGSVHTGRSEDEIGAHVESHNSHSVGICVFGKGKYTLEQWQALALLVNDIQARFPSASVHGHCEYDTAIAQGKTCPDFSIQDWDANGRQPLDGHIFSR